MSSAHALDSSQLYESEQSLGVYTLSEHFQPSPVSCVADPVSSSEVLGWNGESRNTSSALASGTNGGPESYEESLISTSSSLPSVVFQNQNPTQRRPRATAVKLAEAVNEGMSPGCAVSWQQVHKHQWTR
eukprot:Cvel_4306.t1-p1 / transcript=Cvel_4306.t1 / gene=Cvel_4306 / organism=Chromera_velia_CCMP2878 / gene_product=hypothetical protein / transcript_product=hypothetical protein / location=Cvel_scaffold187:647-1119(-) / protein_length=129 / sequence_SO=supercontig / SO=protein_coding / is_pseudo=false